MSNLTTDEFLSYLQKSELLEPGDYEKAVATVRGDAPDAFVSPSLLASVFVKRGYITGWHARQLLKRKYKGFYLRQYRILGRLGAGGMSAVYLGEHTVMRRRVAIKVLPKRRLNAVYLDRFAREAQAIASLDHPNIVRAYDVDHYDDVHYIVMEYFEGNNLRQLVEKEGPLPYEDAVNYIRQAALGLGCAHSNGVVHRDVKPENILVNDQNLVKILDLGLALLDTSNFAQQESIFDEDKILGTADYLAPEQALNSHAVDARADVYGLGATLYFCLTGKPPFPTGSIAEKLIAHQRREPVSIFSERPDAPGDLVEICAVMMQKKPEKRFQSMSQLVETLELWLIRHGFADAGDFARDDSKSASGDESFEGFDDFNEKIFTEVDAERRFFQSESATETGFVGERNQTADGGKSKDENRDGVVELDSPGTGTIPRAPLATGAAPERQGNFLLSGLADAAPVDPLEMAMNEIATGKHSIDFSASSSTLDGSKSGADLAPGTKRSSSRLGMATPFGSSPEKPGDAPASPQTSPKIAPNKEPQT
ncbi:MAG: serine/threonine protein kinase, partial [Thermoguttaceae bacterium]|nr:serine/threonine protein kinase [Thermoguttaceae bacterium]